MWTDPIVEETRRCRTEYAAELGNDLDAIYRDLKEKELKNWDRLVAPSATPVEPDAPGRDVPSSGQ